MSDKENIELLQNLLTYPISQNMYNYLSRVIPGINTGIPTTDECYVIRAIIDNAITKKNDVINDVLRYPCTDEDCDEIKFGWRAFYDEPRSYKNDVIADMILLDLGVEPIEDKYDGRAILDNIASIQGITKVLGIKLKPSEIFTVFRKFPTFYEQPDSYKDNVEFLNEVRKKLGKEIPEEVEGNNIPSEDSSNLKEDDIKYERNTGNSLIEKAKQSAGYTRK